MLFGYFILLTLLQLRHCYVETEICLSSNFLYCPSLAHRVKENNDDDDDDDDDDDNNKNKNSNGNGNGNGNSNRSTSSSNSNSNSNSDNDNNNNKNDLIKSLKICSQSNMSIRPNSFL